MQILFDWELDERVQKPVHTWVYEEIRTFIKGRYKLLEEEVDKATDENNPAFVVIIWHEDGSVEIRPFNIAEHLKQKLGGCVSYDDIDYIMIKIEQAIGNKGNEN